MFRLLGPLCIYSGPFMLPRLSLSLGRVTDCGGCRIIVEIGGENAVFRASFRRSTSVASGWVPTCEEELAVDGIWLKLVVVVVVGLLLLFPPPLLLLPGLSSVLTDTACSAMR
jgi:hypothetical protein